MKNFLMCALILCAIPAVAFGQTVTCDDCTHDVSVYMGSGGLVAETDADEVVFVATCGGVTTSGKWMPNDDGIVAKLFDDDNGLSCHSADERNRLQLGPVMDGGWFYINDEMNSAVGNLVNHDILENEMTDIADAGDSVTSMMGKGAVYLKHTSGRVGILPTILPEMPMPDTPMCGAYLAADKKSVKQTAMGCELGDGSTVVRMVGPAAGGRTTEITNGMVYRNFSGDVTVTVDLWTAGGVISVNSQDAPVGTGYAKLGKALGLSGVAATPGGFFGASLTAALGSGNESLTVTPGDANNDGDHVRITIEDAQTSSLCTATASHDAMVTIKLQSAQAGLWPAVKADGAGNHGVATLTIKCPPASAANQGTELVPENPFPTTE